MDPQDSFRCDRCGFSGGQPIRREDGRSHCPHCHATVNGDDVAPSTAVLDSERLLAMIDRLWQDSIGMSDDPRASIRPAGAVSTSDPRVKIRRQEIGERGDGNGDSQDFELLRELGKGGMGVVYSARQASVDRLVALKMLKGPLAHDRVLRSKFLVEAIVTGDLDHPNIVPVIDLGQAPDGSLFYAMKQVDGETWSSVLRSKSLAENLDILLRVGDAVAFAHSRGVLHRDLKPANVMLGAFGEVLVMDWGLAASAGQPGKAERLTLESARGGTPAYMPPEVALCEVDKVGPASDVYLMGAILFEILTGLPPHPGATVQSALRAAAANTLGETSVEGELMAIARQAMATRPADRYVDIHGFQAAIRGYQEHAASLRLVESARQDLAEARRSRDYACFARALFGYQDARKLWADNHVAANELGETQLAYATCAYERDAFDLAIAVLDETVPAHQPMIRQASRARAQARRRKRSLRAALGIIVVLLAVATTWIFLERGRALAARDAERQQRQLAEAESYANLIGAAALRAASPEYEAANQLLDTAKASARHWEWGYLKKVTENRETVLEGGWTTADRNAPAAFSPDGQWLAISCNQPQSGLVIWQTGSGRQSAFVPMEPGESCSHVAFSPDGQSVAMATTDGRLQVIETASGERRWRVERNRTLGHVPICFSPDGSLLVTAHGTSPEVRMWSATSGQLARTIATGARPWSLAFDGHGQRLLVSLEVGGASVWETGTGNLLVTLGSRSVGPFIGAISQDGEHVVGGSSRIEATIWSIATPADEARLAGMDERRVRAIGYDSRSERILAGTMDHRLMLWDAQGSVLQTFGPIHPSAALVSFHADDTLAAAMTNEGLLHVWRLEDGEPVFAFQADRPAKLQLSADATKLLVLKDNDGPVLMDARRTAAQREVSLADRATGWLLSSDRSLLAGGDRRGTLTVWSVSTGEVVRSWQAHKSYAVPLTWNPQGTRLISVGEEGDLLAWSIDEPTATGRWPRDGPAFTAAAFDPAGRWLWAGDAQGRLHRLQADLSASDWIVNLDNLADVSGGAVLSIVPAPDGSYAIILRRNRQQVVHCLPDGTLQTWQPEALPDRRAPMCLSAAIRPDGQLVATGHADGTIRCWNPTTGELTLTLSAHRDSVRLLRFAPSGRQLYSGSSDRTGQVWDFDTAESTLVAGHSSAMNQGAFSEDGRRLITGATDGRIKVWDLPACRELLDLGEAASSCVGLWFGQDDRTIIGSGADGTTRIYESAPW